MTDTPRKSHRLKLKDRDKQSLNRTLKIKLSKQSEDDEDMSVLQVKQNASSTREIEHFDMRRYRRKRSSNNFLKVHNNYCTYDRSKYDGYDSRFINDSDTTSCNSDGGTDKDLDGEKIAKSKRCVVSSSSDNEVETGLYGRAVDINDKELVERTSPGKGLKRGQLGDRTNHLSDEDLISPARKLKMSILSSDDSDSDSETPLSRKSTSGGRKPSTRAMKVQARMKSDRERQFENFRAKRNRNEFSRIEGKSVTSIPNLGDINRLIDEENELLPSACQGLSKFACKELFGYSEDSASEEEYVLSQLLPHYLEGIKHTKFMVDSQSNDNDTDCLTPLQQPTVYEFSDRTANIVLDSDDGVELLGITKLVDYEDELSPNVFLSTLNEYQDLDPDSTTEDLRNIIAITDPTLELVKDERDIQEDEKILLAERFDLEFSPVDEGRVKTLQDEVVSSFTDRADETPPRPTPAIDRGPTDSDNSGSDESPFVIDYYV